MLNDNKNKTVTIVMAILILMVLGLSGYIIYDKVLQGNENLKEDEKIEETNPKEDANIGEGNPSTDGENMDISMKDNVVYVNGNKVDMYNYFTKKDANHSEWWNNESDFYMHKDGGVDAYFEYKIIDDIVFIVYEPANYLGSQMVFVDKNGVINYDVDDAIAFNGIRYSYVEGNSIIIENRTADAHYEGQACNKVSEGLGNEVGITYYKVKYLGDNKFDIDRKYKELTYNDIVSDKDTFHYYCEY